ncbi:MAG: tryptophan-rich sensory protein [Planctomycetes bacterium]|nr:tryptophan-rich sensory protein [Planctomycetota bacterium]
MRRLARPVSREAVIAGSVPTGRVLLTGATGYIGNLLLTTFVEDGRPARCLVRRPMNSPAPHIEVVLGDVADELALRTALDGCASAIYLVHAMSTAGDFAARDRKAAQTFGRVARESGVGRIIYLGGLGHGSGLSKHLASRQEVGRLLAESGVPVTEFRASIVIGAGSLSFEMIRALVSRLPVMTTPSWVRSLAQPIAASDTVAYLRAALDADPPRPGVFGIGGADRVSYAGLMKEFARQERRPVLLLPIPLLTPWLSSLWLSLVTPLQSSVGAAMIDSVRNDTVVVDDAASRAFPVRPVGVVEAVRRAREMTLPEMPALAGAWSFLALGACLLAVAVAAGLGSLATASSVNGWYSTLRKPAWSPPNTVFGPVWSSLFAMMAVAAWLVWRRDGFRGARLSAVAFVLQLALNVLWSVLFFGLHSPAAALGEIAVLWFAIAATTVIFFARSLLAGALMIPYALWVAFAACLNASLWWLNR